MDDWVAATTRLTIAGAAAIARLTIARLTIARLTIAGAAAVA